MGVGEQRPWKFSARSAEDDARLDMFRERRTRGETLCSSCRVARVTRVGKVVDGGFEETAGFLGLVGGHAVEAGRGEVVVGGLVETAKLLGQLERWFIVGREVRKAFARVFGVEGVAVGVVVG